MTLAEEIRSYGRDNLMAAVSYAYSNCAPIDPGEFAAIDKAVFEAFPDVTIEELIAVWGELARRQMAEAEELRQYAARRRQQ
jgi:hypothetical protein